MLSLCFYSMQHMGLIIIQLVVRHGHGRKLLFLLRDVTHWVTSAKIILRHMLLVRTRIRQLVDVAAMQVLHC